MYLWQYLRILHLIFVYLVVRKKGPLFLISIYFFPHQLSGHYEYFICYNVHLKFNFLYLLMAVWHTHLSITWILITKVKSYNHRSLTNPNHKNFVGSRSLTHIIANLPIPLGVVDLDMNWVSNESTFNLHCL
jgi:hypothetical protein